MRSEIIFEKADSFREAQFIREQGLYPYFREIVSEQDTEVLLASGKKVLMLGSNSYLGLTSHPKVKEAAIEAIRKYGTGCAGSPFLNGTLDVHLQLARELALFVGKEDALLYSTGFSVNQGVITAMLGRHDFLFLDSLNHASILEAARISPAKAKKYRHNNMDDLARIIEMLPAEKGKFLVTDGVFSMDGDITDLPGLCHLAEKHQFAIMLDDAHAFGVIGENGRGTASHFGLTDQVDLIMGTFSKSLASIGGFVASDAQTIEYLKHHSRALIFSASMPPASAASALAALQIIKDEPDRNAKLWANTRQMTEGLKSLGFHTGYTVTPIIPVLIGKDDLCFVFCKELEEAGVFVNPIRYPAVAPNEACLRVSLMATHEPHQIEFALEQFEKIGKKLGIIS
jgi:8-amino-7-oxononanoate synthase